MLCSVRETRRVKPWIGEKCGVGQRLSAEWLQGEVFRNVGGDTVEVCDRCRSQWQLSAA